MDLESLSIAKTASINSLASKVIADIISARILCEPSEDEFNIDGYWSDLREDVLYECQERFRSVKFLTDEEDY